MTLFKCSMLLLLLLSRFSRVRLCATPQMAAHQAPPSLGFSRQEHWSGLPFPSPMHESESESEVTQSCPTLSDPIDCSPPGSGFSRQEYWSRVPLPSLKCSINAIYYLLLFLFSLQSSSSRKTLKFLLFVLFCFMFTSLLSRTQ